MSKLNSSLDLKAPNSAANELARTALSCRWSPDRMLRRGPSMRALVHCAAFGVPEWQQSVTNLTWRNPFNRRFRPYFDLYPIFGVAVQRHKKSRSPRFGETMSPKAADRNRANQFRGNRSGNALWFHVLFPDSLVVVHRELLDRPLGRRTKCRKSVQKPRTARTRR